MIAKPRMVVASCLLALASSLTPNVSQAAPRPARPVEANGHLQVIGNRLSNQAGAPVQLRGVALHGLQWSGWFYENPASLRAAALDWGVDILRISVYVYEGGYLDNETLKPVDFDGMIEGYVATCVETGIYCILDWHVHHPGNPLYYTEQAKLFFDKFSKKYGDLPNVLYEIANEPNRTGYERTIGDELVTVVAPKPTPWTDIKQYADEVIPVIRANDPDGVVLVGTPAWSQLGHADGYPWQEVRDNPAPFQDVAYVVHFYADGHGIDLLNHYKAAAAELPLFATEWSPAHYDRLEPFRPQSGGPWVEWMNQTGIGGAYWMWAAGDTLWATFDESTTAAGPFAPDGANVTASGKYLYEWLNNPPDAWAGQMFDPDNPPAMPADDPPMDPVGMDPVVTDPVVMDPDPVAVDPANPNPAAGAAGSASVSGASGNAASLAGNGMPTSAAGCGCAMQPVSNVHGAWLLALAVAFGVRRRARNGA